LKKEKKTYEVKPSFISKRTSEKEMEALLCDTLKKS